MRYFLFIILVFFSLTSCGTEQQLTVPPAEIREVIIERLVPYELPADSTHFYALLECDSLNNVILKEFSEYKSARIASDFLLSLNRLNYNTYRLSDTVYIRVTDSIRIEKIPYPVEIIEKVKVNELTKFQSTQIKIAWIAEVAVLLYLIIGIKWGNIIKLIKNLINK